MNTLPKSGTFLLGIYIYIYIYIYAYVYVYVFEIMCVTKKCVTFNTYAQNLINTPE